MASRSRPAEHQYLRPTQSHGNLSPAASCAAALNVQTRLGGRRPASVKRHEPGIATRLAVLLAGGLLARALCQVVALAAVSGQLLPGPLAAQLSRASGVGYPAGVTFGIALIGGLVVKGNYSSHCRMNGTIRLLADSSLVTLVIL